jgi:arginine decarboxylase
MVNQNRTPLMDVLLARAKREGTSFHTPGHKNGQGIDPKLRAFTGRNVYKLDVTVFPEVDSLHDPVGAIKKAQVLMAKAYGVKYSQFLVNGSSVGNIAMLMSVCQPGDSVIVSRNAHKSTLSGIIMSGVWPIWIQPKIDQHLDIIFDSDAAQIEEALMRFPEAKAVFVTSPTYHGVTTDLKKIAELCHAHGKFLLVDEAHGAHLKFHRDLPISAVEAGADMCVQSTHKILSALSQGSVLHVNSDMVDMSRVRKILSILQTTSPNYFIMASLDAARRQVFFQGQKIFGRLINLADEARERINRLRHIYCFTQGEIRAKGYDLDVTKLTLNVTRTGMSGHDVEHWLAFERGIQVDCADLFNLIAIMGVGTTRQDVERLLTAMEDLDRREPGQERNWVLQLPSLSTEMAMAPRDVFLQHRTKRVPLSRAAGHISAQTLTPYPPGIPVLIPGERITQEIQDFLMDLAGKDIRISGQDTETLRTVKVVSPR